MLSSIAAHVLLHQTEKDKSRYCCQWRPFSSLLVNHTCLCVTGIILAGWGEPNRRFGALQQNSKVRTSLSSISSKYQIVGHWNRQQLHWWRLCPGSVPLNRLLCQLLRCPPARSWHSPCPVLDPKCQLRLVNGWTRRLTWCTLSQSSEKSQASAASEWEASFPIIQHWVQSQLCDAHVQLKRFFPLLRQRNSTLSQ